MSKNCCFFDEKLWNDFHDLINSEPLKSIVLKNKSLFLFICSFITQTKINLKVLNRQIIDEVDFYNFLLHSSILIESIDEFEKEICELDKEFKINKLESDSLFYEYWKEFWIGSVGLKQNEFTNEMDDALKNDKNFFEYIRAICCTHPLNTSRHPKWKNNFIKKFKKQTLYQIDIRGLAGALLSSKDKQIDVVINIHLLSKNDQEPKTGLLGIRLIDLKQYVLNYYNYIGQIIGWFKGELSNFFENEKNKIHNWPDDDWNFLNYLIKDMKEKYLCLYRLEDFKEQFDFFNKNKIVYKTNDKSIKKYFNYVINFLRKDIVNIIEAFDENYNYEFCPIDSKIDEQVFQKNKVLSENRRICDVFSYEIEKLSYLEGDRSWLMPKCYEPCQNKEWGLYQASLIYENFAKNYVFMDLYNPELSFIEINLLIAVAFFMHK